MLVTVHVQQLTNTHYQVNPPLIQNQSEEIRPSFYQIKIVIGRWTTQSNTGPTNTTIECKKDQAETDLLVFIFMPQKLLKRSICLSVGLALESEQRLIRIIARSVQPTDLNRDSIEPNWIIKPNLLEKIIEISDLKTHLWSGRGNKTHYLWQDLTDASNKKPT